MDDQEAGGGGVEKGGDRKHTAFKNLAVKDNDFSVI